MLIDEIRSKQNPVCSFSKEKKPNERIVVLRPAVALLFEKVTDCSIIEGVARNLFLVSFPDLSSRPPHICLLTHSFDPHHTDTMAFVKHTLGVAVVLLLAHHVNGGPIDGKLSLPQVSSSSFAAPKTERAA